MNPRFLFVTRLTLLIGGADNRDSDQAPEPAPPPPVVGLDELPVEMNLRQNSTEAVFGSHDKLLLTVGEGTAQRINVSVSTSAKETLVPSREMTPGDEVDFEWIGKKYQLTLKDLEFVADLGYHYVTVRISTPDDSKSTNTLNLPKER
jgi:hypothetical protein